MTNQTGRRESQIPDRQVQRTSGADRAIQSGRDTHYHEGTSERRAWEIADYVVARELEKFEKAAYAVASARVEQLRTELIDRISSLETSSLEAFEDPDVQILISDAQKNFARSGKEEHRSALVDLIAMRCGAPSGSIQSTILREAVDAVPKLSASVIDAIVLIWHLTRVKQTSIRDREEFAGMTRESVAPFVGALPQSNASYDLIESVGCGSRAIGPSTIPMIMRHSYPALFVRGFRVEDLDQELQVEGAAGDLALYINSFDDPSSQDLRQVAFMDADMARDALREANYADSFIDKYVALYAQYAHGDDEVENILRTLDPCWSKIIDTWNSTDISSIRLNSVGFAVAHCRWTNVTRQEADLSIWVPVE